MTRELMESLATLIVFGTLAYRFGGWMADHLLRKSAQ